MIEPNSEQAIYSEYDRIRQLLRDKEIKSDNTLAIVDIDGLLWFTRLDFIPWFYISGERVEELLNFMINDLGSMDI